MCLPSDLTKLLWSVLRKRALFTSSSERTSWKCSDLRMSLGKSNSKWVKTESKLPASSIPLTNMSERQSLPSSNCTKTLGKTTMRSWRCTRYFLRLRTGKVWTVYCPTKNRNQSLDLFLSWRLSTESTRVWMSHTKQSSHLCYDVLSNCHRYRGRTSFYLILRKSKE